MRPVLDEVDALDRIDFRDALRVPERVPGTEGQREDDRAVPKRTPIADPHQGNDDGHGDRQGDCRADDRRVLTRERGPDPVPDVPDEGGRQDDGHGDDDGQQESQAQHRRVLSQPCVNGGQFATDHTGRLADHRASRGWPTS